MCERDVLRADLSFMSPRRALLVLSVPCQRRARRRARADRATRIDATRRFQAPARRAARP